MKRDLTIHIQIIDKWIVYCTMYRVFHKKVYRNSPISLLYYACPRIKPFSTYDLQILSHQIYNTMTLRCLHKGQYVTVSLMPQMPILEKIPGNLSCKLGEYGK